MYIHNIPNLQNDIFPPYFRASPMFTTYFENKGGPYVNGY